MKTFIDMFDRHFDEINKRSRAFVELIPRKNLFSIPYSTAGTAGRNSCGENILRSAAAVEQTFGGITTRLWDDPFEWTLPEYLSTSNDILEYFTEVEETRLKGFTYFTSDADLVRKLPAPTQIKSIFELLLETVSRAEHFQGRAFSIFQTISGEKLPRL